ncbi:MAG: cob(I)yrinic acid a,c-diamide adenosyltransferase [Thermodesulfobacteriota bacterium]|nr:cob(I)yrinic acid a,c-diamide adenosyltransferase [Thermodesulfobacteriota bacterium]
MVILDEFTYILNYEFTSMDEVIACIQQREQDLHVIITGRDAPRAIIETEDLVTIMEEVKHPLKAGVKAQKEIEF